MQEIPLTQDYVALVDDEDYEWLSRYSWHAVAGGKDRRYVYAERSVYDGGKVKHFLMHKEILGCVPGEIVDHIDRNTLNNTRANLRRATIRTNAQNKAFQSGQYKGITFTNNRWIARIKTETRRLYLGTFDTPEDAARAYNVAAKLHFGEFAYLNEVPE